jgi:DNA (cytosine-5)-methyltransferase 1
VWFSQYDPEHNYKNGPDFPSSVLAHRFPEVPNLGDMTKLRDHAIYKNSEFDLLVGGTPCQAFSIAGLRAGLADDRSNLALEFVRILGEKRPRWFLWENVPGVLSSNGGADFASILSGFTGRDVGVQKFEKAGIIEGDEYSIAWRVLDSQYFGVPQRRRRVFVVGHLGNDWRPPTAVLFEPESLRRDFTPGGKKRKGTTGSTESRITCTGDGITGTVSCKWAKGTGGPAGDEHYNLVAQP